MAQKNTTVEDAVQRVINFINDRGDTSKIKQIMIEFDMPITAFRPTHTTLARIYVPIDDVRSAEITTEQTFNKGDERELENLLYFHMTHKFIRSK